MIPRIIDFSARNLLLLKWRTYGSRDGHQTEEDMSYFLSAHHKRLPLLAFLGLLAIVGGAAASPDTDAKIDEKLIAAMMDSDDGTAPFFVVFGERPSLEAASRIRDWAARGRVVVQTLQGTANRSQNGVRKYLQGRSIAHAPFWVENKIYIRKGTLDLARKLAGRPEVAAIIPEVIYAVPRPQASGPGIQAVAWNLSLIGAPQVWSTYGNAGEGIVVASIDTGVEYSHPALVRQYRGNLGGGSFNHSGSWHDPANDCGGAPCDTAGHGTHTMGTLVGDDGVGNQIGVAPGARWIACKGCTAAICPTSSLIACAQWILAPGGDAANRPNIVNNSWVGNGGDDWFQSYLKSWIAAGIFPAFANGNTGPGCGTAGSPGDYPEAFASGATDINDNTPIFSSRGPSAFLDDVKPDVTAPGVDIYSAFPGGRYGYLSGSSVASPHTAGTVALLWAIRPGYRGNIAGTESLLIDNAAVRTTTETCGGIAGGASPNNTYGSGRIDAKQTVDAAAAPVKQPPTVTITMPAVDGQQFNCGTLVEFAATASDPEDGNLSSAIHWRGPGTPARGIGPTITKTFRCSNPGNKTITARVRDSTRLRATDTIVVNIINPGKPAAPSDLVATVSGSDVILTWTDNAVNETGFKVHRRKKVVGRWGKWAVRQKIAVADTTSFVDAGAGTGVYQYYVTAYSPSGTSAPSNAVVVSK
jgi:subtilisin family serine protease